MINIDDFLYLLLKYPDHFSYSFKNKIKRFKNIDQLILHRDFGWALYLFIMNILESKITDEYYIYNVMPDIALFLTIPHSFYKETVEEIIRKDRRYKQMYEENMRKRI